MDLNDFQPIDRPADYSGRRPLFYLVVLLPTLLGLAHHIDHLIRGNHVGWPVTPHVNAFTYSLAIYPLIAIGVYLTVTDRVGVRYWTGVFGFSAVLLAYVHISPWAIEPPADVIGPYANPLFGYAAFAILLALIASVGVGTLYVLGMWARQRKRDRTASDGTDNR